MKNLFFTAGAILIFFLAFGGLSFDTPEDAGAQDEYTFDPDTLRGVETATFLIDDVWRFRYVHQGAFFMDITSASASVTATLYTSPENTGDIWVPVYVGTFTADTTVEFSSVIVEAARRAKFEAISTSGDTVIIDYGHSVKRTPN